LPGLTAAVAPACSKCKLYRFDPAGQEWKERGVGMAKLLKHKENQRIRLLMRQDKTLKIRANHLGRFGSGLGPHPITSQAVCQMPASNMY
jgi:Ran-binding protein 1